MPNGLRSNIEIASHQTRTKLAVSDGGNVSLRRRSGHGRIRCPRNKCGELYAEAERVNGKTGLIAVTPNGDACEVWSDEVGNDPDDVCRIPRSYPAEVDVLVHPEGFFICPGR